MQRASRTLPSSSKTSIRGSLHQQPNAQHPPKPKKHPPKPREAEPRGRLKKDTTRSTQQIRGSLPPSSCRRCCSRPRINKEEAVGRTYLPQSLGPTGRSAAGGEMGTLPVAASSADAWQDRILLVGGGRQAFRALRPRRSRLWREEEPQQENNECWCVETAPRSSSKVAELLQAVF